MSGTRQAACRFGEFTLDLARGALFRSGDEVKLHPKVFEVLKYLVENSGRLVGKEEIAKASASGSISCCISSMSTSTSAFFVRA